MSGLRTVETDDTLDMGGFREYTRRMNERYDDQGVWGLNRGAPTGVGERFVGAWTSSSSENERANTKNLDHAAILYRLDDTSTGRKYRLWLWSAVEGKPDSGLFGDSQNVQTIEHGISLYGDQSLLDHSPTSDLSASKSPASVGFGEKNVQFPIASGRINVDESKIETGEAGSYCTEWSGSYEGIQSMHSLVEINDSRSDSEHYFSIDLNYRVSQWGI